jgi:hypothetical protein
MGEQLDFVSVAFCQFGDADGCLIDEQITRTPRSMIASSKS